MKINLKINLKKVLILCVLCMMILGVRVFAFEDGDYVKLGTYNGQEILWRVVSVEDNHLNLISDKILDFKQFDDTNNGVWKTSTLRQWLNSDAGFLKEFTEEDKKVLTPVTYDTLLNKKNSASATSGTKDHLFSSNAKVVAKNYDAAYKQRLTDMVTLPSVTDIQTIANGIYTYGTEYQVASLASNLTAPFGDGNSGYYWLRDAMFAADTSLVRCMRSDNTVEYARANNGEIGVRPICFVKGEIAIVGGNGSEAAPYRLQYTSQIRLTAPDSVCLTGGRINIQLTSVLQQEGSTFRVYSNSEYIGTTEDEVIPVTVKQGANILSVEVFDANGEYLYTSDPIRFTGVEFKATGNVKHSLNFDQESAGRIGKYEAYDKNGTGTTIGEYGLTGFGNVTSHVNTEDVNASWTSYGKWEIEDYQNRGRVLKLSGLYTTRNCGAQLYNFPSDYDITAMEMDFSVETLGVIEAGVCNLKLQKEDGTTFWHSQPLTIDASGNLWIKKIKSGERVIAKIQEGTWYNIKVMVSNARNTMSVILTEDGGSPQLLCYEEAMYCYDSDRDVVVDKFKCVSYGEISFRNTNTVPYVKYMDNICLQERTLNTESADSLLAGAHIVDGTQTVSVALNNTADKAVTPLLMRATYQNKKLVSLSYDDTTDVPADSSKIAMLESDTAIPTDATTKVFAWSDFTGMVPLNNAITVK